MVADGGRAKASVHHDSQSNDCVGSGKGSETVCFFGAQPDPLYFLTAGSSEFDSDKRLFLERRRGKEEVSAMGGVVEEGELEAGEVHLGGGSLVRMIRQLVPCKMKKILTIDVCGARVRSNGVREGTPGGSASAFARAGKHHRRYVRSRWNW